MKKLLFLLGLLVAPAAWAADGDACDTNNWPTYDAYKGGRMMPVWCFVLCDADTNNGACADFDMNTTQDVQVGNPDVLTFVLDNSACGTGTITFATAYQPSGDESALDSSTTAISVGGTERLNLDTRVAPVGRIIASDRTAMGCDDGTLDVLLIGWEHVKD